MSLLLGRLYGPAYEASFILAKTEDIRIENVVEEDSKLILESYVDIMLHFQHKSYIAKAV